MSSLWPYAAALLPSIGVGYIFYLIIKNILEGDRNERLAQARWEKQQEQGVAPQSNEPPSRP